MVNLMDISELCYNITFNTPFQSVTNLYQEEITFALSFAVESEVFKASTLFNPKCLVAVTDAAPTVFTTRRAIFYRRWYTNRRCNVDLGSKYKFHPKFTKRLQLSHQCTTVKYLSTKSPIQIFLTGSKIQFSVKNTTSRTV